MEIVFLGHASFRLKGKTASVVTDPFDAKMVGLKYPSTEADIVTVSHQHEDHNQITNVKSVQRVIEGPGEYEVAGISIIGFQSFHDDKNGELRGKNTIYVIELDGIRIAHLGDLGHKISEDMLEEIGTIDILMIPVGGEYTIGPSLAAEIVRDIEPKIAIPMHYLVEGMDQQAFGKLSDVDSFLKETGMPVEKLPKLSTKKEELAEEQKVVVLNRKS